MSSVERYESNFWSPNGDKARAYMEERGFNEEILKRFRVGYCDRDGSYFSGRVLFPIFRPDGVHIGFSGRSISSSDLVKYKNSPESDVFQKSRCLFGITQAKESIFTKDKAILVEGFTDVMALHQAGLTNTVAGMGTALTDHHITLVARYTRNVLLCFDGDEKGQAAYRKVDEKCKRFGLRTAKLRLPPGKDPADVVMAKP